LCIRADRNLGILHGQRLKGINRMRVNAVAETGKEEYAKAEGRRL
jgi:hypothetical protein